MKTPNLPKYVARLAALAFSAGVACASVVGSDSTFSLTVHPGATVTLTASLTNSADSPVDLNSDSLNFEGPSDFSFSDEFADNAPLSLNAKEVSSPYEWLSLSIPSNAVAGHYTGMITILGGDFDFSQSIIGQQAFSVQVVPTAGAPDAASLYLVLPALLTLVLRRKLTLATVAAQEVVR